MVYEFILIGILLIFLVILIARRIEGVPRLIFWLIARDITSEDSTLMTPSDLGLTAEVVEIPMKERPINAWFFPSEVASTAGILMVPNWFQKEDHKNNLKTAGILHTAGYNVLLPIYHWNLDETMEFTFKKRSVGPKKCQEIIDNAYDYFITRPEIDKRNIGIWSNASGTILACQLIKNSPIKAAVLEDGPVSLWNNIALMLHEKKNFSYLRTKFVLILLLFPFLWRTRWESKRAVKNLRACPSFLIALREELQKNLWQTFSSLNKPRQLWFEHALYPNIIRDTWLQEYFLQIRSFYDFWMLDSPQPEFHYDFSVKRRKEGKYPIEIRITAIPPQLEKVPLQIILSDNFYFNELRIWFSGALMTITHSLKYKPKNISVIQFMNVEPGRHPQRQWLKRDARLAFFVTIEKITRYPPERVSELLERYFFVKSILLNEQEIIEDAKEALKTSITSEYWKTIVKRDSDTRFILQEDLEEPLISTADSIFMTS